MNAYSETRLECDMKELKKQVSIIKEMAKQFKSEAEELNHKSFCLHKKFWKIQSKIDYLWWCVNGADVRAKEEIEGGDG